MYDAIIIGGGPAGLSAALILGRCRRKVIVLDSGNQRNIKSNALHAYLTRDGIKPVDFLRKSREELKKYGIEIRDTEVKDIVFEENGFEVVTVKNETFKAKKILIATGLIDNIPEVKGIHDFYGKSIFHCPYCDGWEVQEKQIAAYGKGKNGAALAASLKTWSSDVFLCTDGSRLESKLQEDLSLLGIKVFTDKISKLEGKDGQLRSIHFENGENTSCDVMFFTTGQKQHSSIAERLGCQFNKKGFIISDKKQQTCVKGVYVAGDAVKDVKFVIVAAAEGARAGVAINTALQEEEILNLNKTPKLKLKPKVARDSEVIEKIAYDPKEKILEIKLKNNGKIYHYHKVPEEVYFGLINSDSKDEFFDKKIKDQGFKCEEVG